MNKKSTQFKWLVTMLLLVAAMAMPKMAWAKITPTKPSGKGTADSPYQIGTAAELYWFAALVNGDTKAPKVSSANTGACAKLTADITVNTGVLKTDGTLADDVSSFTTWTPIGTLSQHFTGTFDGQGHTISGLYFNSVTTYFVGLFGNNNGTIKNVGVVDSYFEGRGSVGGVCGDNSGTITGCYYMGSVSGNEEVGGVCGYNYAYKGTATITNCYNTGAVSGFDKVGGVCGYNKAYDGTATITNCYYNSDKYTGKAVNNTNGTVTDVEGKTTEQLKSGEVCYLLNGKNSENTSGNPLIWYQNIGSESSDISPVLDNSHRTVYRGYDGCKKVYSNENPINQTQGEHSYNKGICSKCGDYQPATKNSSDQYEISYAGQIYWFAALINGTLEGETQNTSANAVLTADITVNTGVLKTDGTLADDVSSFTTWTPIGTKSKPFTGTFDGQGHTISGLYFDNENTNSVGLFGCNGGTIKNVGVIDSYFKGWRYVGGVCGYNHAQNAKATITNCYYTGTVSGFDIVGGVCGYNNALNATATITNCYNTGAVSSNYYVGGVCGRNYALNATATITNCYNTGTVSGNYHVGCVCGNNYALSATATIKNCYYNSDKYTGKAVNNTNGTVTDVEGKTTEQLKSGEVCYLLNGKNSENTSENPLIWYQNIGSESSDISPVLDNSHRTVYRGYDGCKKVYSNENTINQTQGEHSYNKGICSECGEYQPATTNSSGQYEISYAGQLYWFAALVNGTLEGETQNTSANAVLTADITVNTGVLKTDGTLVDDVSSFTTWTPIGTKSKPFTGTFDGQGHTISGLYFDNEDTNGVGLFGFNGGTIKNVGVIDSYFKGGNSVGGVCGFNYALNATATITNCYNTGTVSGNNVVGGVCGNNYAQNAKATITNCYNTGAVSGNNAVGGVCGNNYALNDTATITNCYNTGIVSGNNVVGCVCGYNVAYEGTATITNCYYNSDKYTGKAVNNKNGTVTDVEGKTTEQFKSGEVCSLLMMVAVKEYRS